MADTGGRTTVRHAEGAEFDTVLRALFASRDLGMKDASAAAIGAKVVRAVPGVHARPDAPQSW